jgi:hypothetical protein
MSAAGRLSTLGLAFALCLMSSTTSDPPRVPQQQGQGLNVSSPGRWLPAKSPELASSFVEPTVVTLTDRPVKLPVALGQALVPRGVDTIGRQLQEELRRVGCYGGELNGVWTTSTRRAMHGRGKTGRRPCSGSVSTNARLAECPAVLSSARLKAAHSAAASVRFT